MASLKTRIIVSDKRTRTWTGILQRVLRDFAVASPIALTERDVDRLLDLPDRLVDLVLSGALQHIELQADGNSFVIEFGSEPESADALGLPTPDLSAFAGTSLVVLFGVNDIALARAMGIDQIRRRSSRRLRFLVRARESESIADASTNAGSRGIAGR